MHNFWLSLIYGIITWFKPGFTWRLHQVGYCKLMTWPQGTFSQGNTCLARICLSLSTWGTPKEESCGIKYCLWQPHMSRNSCVGQIWLGRKLDKSTLWYMVFSFQVDLCRHFRIDLGDVLRKTISCPWNLPSSWQPCFLREGECCSHSNC